MTASVLEIFQVQRGTVKVESCALDRYRYDSVCRGNAAKYVVRLCARSRARHACSQATGDRSRVHVPASLDVTAAIKPRKKIRAISDERRFSLWRGLHHPHTDNNTTSCRVRAADTTRDDAHSGASCDALRGG